MYRAEPSAAGGGGAGGSAASGGAASVISGVGGDGTELALPMSRFGNYQNDGTLMSFAFADGAIKQIATALPGPVGLGVTSKQAYVYVDGAPLIGSAIHSQLLRLPLAGGATELVQNQTDPSSFLGVGDLAFWTTATGTYSESSDAGATPSVFFEGSRYSVSGFVADGANLDFMFYDSSLADTVIESEPLVGGAAQSLGLAGLSFGLKDQALFGIEEIDNHTGLIFNQAAKGGGAWQRIRALGAGGNPTLQIAGDRLYWSSNPPQGGYQQVDENRVSIQTASFGSDTPPVRLLELPVPFHYTPLRVPDWATQAFWVGTPSALYWTDGSAIYSFSATNLP